MKKFGRTSSKTITGNRKKIRTFSSFISRFQSSERDSDSDKKKTSDFSGKPSSPEEERRIVTDLLNKADSDLKEGDFSYLISKRWFTKWERFVGLLAKEFPPSEVIRPGPIDNNDIIESESDASDPQLRMLLEKGIDYTLVPQEVWRKLLEWYKGGPPIPRTLICQGFYTKRFSVELYPLCLMLKDSRDQSTTVIRLSKQASIGQLYDMVCDVQRVANVKHARIWSYFEKKERVLLDPLSDKSVEECLQLNQDILLDVDEEPTRSDAATSSTDHSICSKCCLSGRNASEDDVPLKTFGKKQRGGLQGLANLGNTCFMNSVLQCLAHSPAIVKYFMRDYSADINIDPLGMGMRGKLAISFGELLTKMWLSGHTVLPQDFKETLAEFYPQYRGTNQHDSQELLILLLNGLHEDLNRVKKKAPYIKAKDAYCRPDFEVAEENWKNHKSRNDSVIVDVFHGQSSSALVCPNCELRSVTFEPFMCLPLSLPWTPTRSMTVTVLYGDGSHLPRPYTVTVPQGGSCTDLNNAIGSACSLKEDEIILLAQIADCNITKYYENPTELLSTIKGDQNIVAYRFNRMHTGPGKVKLQILHGEEAKSTCSLDGSGANLNIFGTPVVTYIKEGSLGTDVAAVISVLLSSLVRREKENGHLADVAVDDDRLKPCSFLLADFSSCSFITLDPTFVVRPATTTTVLVKWSEKAFEECDLSFLNDPLEVQNTRQDELSLLSCLEAFLEEEHLGADDMGRCRCCGESRGMKKKLNLWKLPEILVFHLKRFIFVGGYAKKIDTSVSFPIHQLDLSKLVKSNDDQCHVYELYAVCNHLGDDVRGGHYYAYAKMMDEESIWYKFNDDSVSLISESEINTPEAYVLFYKRV